VKSVYIALNFRHFAIYVPTIIKIGGNLTKHKKMHSFLRHGVVPFERLGTVSSSHSLATIAVPLAVLPQHTNVTHARPGTA